MDFLAKGKKIAFTPVRIVLLLFIKIMSIMLGLHKKRFWHVDNNKQYSQFIITATKR